MRPHGSPLHSFRLRRRRHRRPYWCRWRLADDAAAGAGLRRASGHRGRHRPALRGTDQGRRHRRARPQGHIDWAITGRLALGSIPAAAITIYILSQLPKGSNAIGAVISHGLGFALLLTAVAILFGRKLRDYASKHENSALRQCCLGKITVAVGAILGVLVTISSVGAGALGVAALFFLYPKLSPVRIVGSDVAHAVPLTLVAGLGHWMLGGVDWSLLGALLLGSLPGIWLGTHVSAKVPEHILRRILASMLVLIGGKLVFA